jgi:hypothetical protein
MSLPEAPFSELGKHTLEVLELMAKAKPEQLYKICTELQRLSDDLQRKANADDRRRARILAGLPPDPPKGRNPRRQSQD